MRLHDLLKLFKNNLINVFTMMKSFSELCLMFLKVQTNDFPVERSFKCNILTTFFFFFKCNDLF